MLELGSWQSLNKPRVTNSVLNAVLDMAVNPCVVTAVGVLVIVD